MHADVEKGISPPTVSLTPACLNVTCLVKLQPSFPFPIDYARDCV